MGEIKKDQGAACMGLFRDALHVSNKTTAVADVREGHHCGVLGDQVDD